MKNFGNQTKSPNITLSPDSRRLTNTTNLSNRPIDTVIKFANSFDLRHPMTPKLKQVHDRQSFMGRRFENQNKITIKNAIQNNIMGSLQKGSPEQMIGINSIDARLAAIQQRQMFTPDLIQTREMPPIGGIQIQQTAKHRSPILLPSYNLPDREIFSTRSPREKIPLNINKVKLGGEVPVDNTYLQIGFNHALRQSTLTQHEKPFEWTQTTDRGNSLNQSSLDKSIDFEDSLDQFSLPVRFQTTAQPSPRKKNRVRKQPILSNSIHFKQSQGSQYKETSRLTTSYQDQQAIEKMSQDFVNYARRQANQDQLRGKITMKHKGEFSELSNTLSGVCETPDSYKNKRLKMKNDLKVINNLRHSLIVPNTTTNADISRNSQFTERFSMPSQKFSSLLGQKQKKDLIKYEDNTSRQQLVISDSQSINSQQVKTKAPFSTFQQTQRQKENLNIRTDKVLNNESMSSQLDQKQFVIPDYLQYNNLKYSQGDAVSKKWSPHSQMPTERLFIGGNQNAQTRRSTNIESRGWNFSKMTSTIDQDDDEQMFNIEDQSKQASTFDFGSVDHFKKTHQQISLYARVQNVNQYLAHQFQQKNADKNNKNARRTSLDSDCPPSPYLREDKSPKQKKFTDLLQEAVKDEKEQESQFKINASVMDWKVKQRKQEQKEMERRLLRKSDKFKSKLDTLDFLKGEQKDFNQKVSKMIIKESDVARQQEDFAAQQRKEKMEAEAEEARQQRNVENVLKIMQDSTKDGTQRKLSRQEMRQLIQYVDFIVVMSVEKRRKFQKRLQALLSDFEADEQQFEEEAQNKFSLIKACIAEIELSLGMIHIQKTMVHNYNYNIKNSALMEMIASNKNDKVFKDQIEHANAETRELMNQLIASYQQEDKKSPSISPKRPQSILKKASSIDSQSSILDNANTPKQFVYRSPHISTTDLRIHKKKSSVHFLERGNSTHISEIQTPSSPNPKLIRLKHDPSKLTSLIQYMEGVQQTPKSPHKKFDDQFKGQVIFNPDGEIGELKDNLKKGIGKMVHIQQNVDTHKQELTKEKGFQNLQNIFGDVTQIQETQQEDSDSEETARRRQESARSQAMNILQSHGKKCGSAVQKFREIVQKHFITKSLKDLEAMDDGQVNMTMLLRLSELRNALDVMLPEGSQYTIGERYKYLDKNLYANEFLQNILSNIPQFKNQLNLKTQVSKSKKELKYDSDGNVIETQTEQDSEAEDTNLEDSRSDISVFKVAEQDPKTAQRRPQQPKDTYTLNQLFLEQTDKKKFWDMAKKKHISAKQDEDHHLMAMKQYYSRCQENKIVAQPFFLTFDNNLLYICQDRINLTQAQALNEYLVNTRFLDNKRIFKLVIDQCLMKDEVLAEILNGCYSQCSFNQKGEIEVQYITTLIYNQGEFGQHSLQVIQKLIPNLVELSFNNIAESGGFNSKVLLSMIEQIAKEGKMLMKLRVSNVFMNNQPIVDGLCNILRNCKVLTTIDFSWSSMSSKKLSEIAEALMERKDTMRSIDFSYNKLAPEDMELEDNFVPEFIDKMCEFLEEAIVINHLKLSGMFSIRIKEQLYRLLQQAIKSHLMLAIHLNDNELNGPDTETQKYMADVLDIFGLNEDDLIENNKSQTVNKLELPVGSLPPPYIDYKSQMRSYLSSHHPHSSSTKGEYHRAQALNLQRKKYKDHILLGKQQKIVENFKAINNCQTKQGHGRLDNNEIDQFVVSRIVNYPELIFNQRYKNDRDKRIRYFEKDHAQKWNLSQRDECYVCQKHRYTIVFFEKGILAQNPELIEIQDLNFLNLLKDDFNRNYINYKSMTPYICGTVVKKPNKMPEFNRKLKMMRANMFTLMCISGSKLFISHKGQIGACRNGVLKWLDHDSEIALENMNVKERLVGWQSVLDDKCNANELTDITHINSPNFEQDFQHRDYYVYAAFLPPGYHQLMIYDPAQERAFVKDFIVGMNRKDFFPEYPLMHGRQTVKTVQNVWRDWKEDTYEDLAKSFNKITTDKQFDMSKFLKKENDIEDCLSIILDNFNLIKIYQRELIVGSIHYPQIDFKRIFATIQFINDNFNLTKIQKVTKEQLELSFIQATRFDDTVGLKSAMQRQELIEFILRIAYQWCERNYKGQRVADNLQEFIDLFIKPIHDRSLIIEHRKLLRGSEKLNEFLFDNQKCLMLIYEDTKSKKGDLKGYTMESAIKFIQSHPELSKGPGEIQTSTIQQCFVFSQMTVLNEHVSLKRYDYIEFVEWLDFICRISIHYHQHLGQETVTMKVQTLLEIIYDRRYRAGVWNNEDHVLVLIQDDSK